MTKEKAIEKVREMKLSPGKDAELIIALHTLIPELRESEDERIRKGIVETIKQCPDTFLNPKNRDRMLTYLEKQKDASKAIEAVDRIDKYIDEHLANAHDMKDSNPDKKYYRGWDDALGKMAGILQDVYSWEKQKEPENVSATTMIPSCWAEEPSLQKEQKPEDRFEEAREKYQVEWSEEDEKKIGRLRSVVNQLAFYTDSLDVNGDYCAGDYAELDAWLKSLRPKHKVDDFTVEEFNAISKAIEILYGSHFAIVPPLKDILTKMAQYDKGTV